MRFLFVASNIVFTSLFLPLISLNSRALHALVTHALKLTPIR